MLIEFSDIQIGDRIKYTDEYGDVVEFTVTIKDQHEAHGGGGVWLGERDFRYGRLELVSRPEPPIGTVLGDTTGSYAVNVGRAGWVLSSEKDFLSYRMGEYSDAQRWVQN